MNATATARDFQDASTGALESLPNLRLVPTSPTAVARLLWAHTWEPCPGVTFPTQQEHDAIMAQFRARAAVKCVDIRSKPAAEPKPRPVNLSLWGQP